MLLILLFVIIALFGKVRATEKSEFNHLKIKENEVETHNVQRYFRMIFNELLEKIPDLEKEKYSNILFDFLGPYKPSFAMDHLLVWYVDVALDQITVAKFECKSCKDYKYCKLKTVNGELFEGVVEFHFYEYDKNARNPRVKIHIPSLFVADYTPRISGNLVLNLVKKMTDSLQPDVVATLEDGSNVRGLALITTGLTYYEFHGFHYVHRDTQERNNFQKTKINTTSLVSCVTQKLDERMEFHMTSFLFDRRLKQAILGALRKEIGQGSRHLGEFWKIYRNVMKSVDFYALKEKFDFNDYLQRYSKNYFFTRYLRECLQEQIIKDEGICGFKLSTLEMSYP